MKNLYQSQERLRKLHTKMKMFWLLGDSAVFIWMQVIIYCLTNNSFTFEKFWTGGTEQQTLECIQSLVLKIMMSQLLLPENNSVHINNPTVMGEKSGGGKLLNLKVLL